MPAIARRMISPHASLAFALVAALTAVTAFACSTSHPVDQPDAGTGGATPEGDAGADADAFAPDAPDAPAEADGGCMLDLPPDAGACDQCKAEKCCGTASAQQKKPGSWTNSAALVCAENLCATECGLTVPKCGGITPDPASCLDALDAMCCDLVTACGESDACIAVIYLCIDDQNNDPGSAGFDACAAGYPGGLAVFNPLNDCFSQVSCP